MLRKLANVLLDMIRFRTILDAAWKTTSWIHTTKVVHVTTKVLQVARTALLLYLSKENIKKEARLM